MTQFIHVLYRICFFLTKMKLLLDCYADRLSKMLLMMRAEALVMSRMLMLTLILMLVLMMLMLLMR